jgi:hypothetical protein
MADYPRWRYKNVKEALKTRRVTLSFANEMLAVPIAALWG